MFRCLPCEEFSGKEKDINWDVWEILFNCCSFPFTHTHTHTHARTHARTHAHTHAHTHTRTHTRTHARTHALTRTFDGEGGLHACDDMISHMTVEQPNPWDPGHHLHSLERSGEEVKDVCTVDKVRLTHTHTRTRTRTQTQTHTQCIKYNKREQKRGYKHWADKELHKEVISESRDIDETELLLLLVISRLDYCNSLLACLPSSAIRPLQPIQNAAAWLVFNLPKFTHWLPVAVHIRFMTVVLAYSAVKGSGPVYIQDMVRPYTPACPLRSASANRLAAPILRVSHSTKSRLFAALAPKWWNKIPIDSWTAESLHIFRRRLKTHLLRQHLA